MAAPALIFNDPPAKTRDDFRSLSDREIFRRIAAAETAQEEADTDHDWAVAFRELIELRAVLDERRF